VGQARGLSGLSLRPPPGTTGGAEGTAQVRGLPHKGASSLEQFRATELDAKALA